MIHDHTYVLSGFWFIFPGVLLLLLWRIAFQSTYDVLKPDSGYWAGGNRWGGFQEDSILLDTCLGEVFAGSPCKGEALVSGKGLPVSGRRGKKNLNSLGFIHLNFPNLINFSVMMLALT